MKTKGAIFCFAALVLTISAGALAHGQPAAEARMKPAAQQLVILDTDIGDDIDDAFALALLLRSPEVKLLGITTAFGDTELRARLVDRYLASVGREEIPVQAGVFTSATNHFTQAAYALQAPGQKHGDAVAFLLREIRAHPGEITLIAIGPLFNVQAAVERDPAIFRKLKRVVLTGGSIDRGYDNEKSGNTHEPPSPEWNIRCDPAGLRALLKSSVPVFMMPLDSTQIHLTLPELGQVLSSGSPLSDQLTFLYHEWTGASAWRMPTLFDPVATAYAIRPELCPVEPMRLDVDDNGFTRPVAGPPNVEVCLKSDEKGFLDFLLKRIAGAQPNDQEAK
ncbi:Inosine-uridine preferring nucleoside hydrolase [Candidatus Sulfotelmatomonas gaucii]|uniref:Inosine-uridine preferring nucleoside hydrolase n=1 Tax=Candidatus Sulfuritelmatomonas gaucii TaxID=2043161 RepID=A0A2N9M082_9BACT|nr:Inosine-uridine preferring nucleoside hydrolase [Candidatus Sulfotelmatomonas gaucii]